MDTTDGDAFWHFASPRINEDDDSMQLFDGLDSDPMLDLIRQPISSSFSYGFNPSLPPKSHDSEDTSLVDNGNRRSPDSSSRDSISTASNDLELDGSTAIKQENSNGQVYDINTSTAPSPYQINTMTSSPSEIEDSNRAMESHFDFDSAGTTPDNDIMETEHVHRHVAIPAATSPSQASLISPTIEQFTPAAPPMSSILPQDINPSIYNNIPMTLGYTHPNFTTPHTLPFGYQFDARIPAATTAVARNQLTRDVHTNLWIDMPKATSRVEIQIPIKLALYPFPPGIKKVHLQSWTISRAKFFAKPAHQPSPDTLELYATLVCASALTDAEKRSAAFKMAAQDQKTRQKPAARPISKGKQLDKKSAEDVVQESEVWICEGCIKRERKRNERKKQKKQDDEEAWQEYEEERVIVFNTSEIKEWKEFVSPDRSEKCEKERQYAVPKDPPAGSMQVDLPMRIACYCRHHDEKQGFQVIFTLKTHLGELVTQNITPPINITDDHKAAAKDSLHASMWNTQVPSPDLDQEAIHQNPGPVRNSLSTTDLQGLQQAFTRSIQTSGFSAPFANPQHFAQYSQASPISRGVSRQASPSYSRPASKKRKSVSSSTRLPESLKMTRLQPGGSQTNGASTSYPASPVSPASSTSGVRTVRPPKSYIDSQSALSYASPESNGFGSEHRSSRSLSHENLSGMQGMYSAPTSVLPSRVPSPTLAGAHFTDLGNRQFPQQATAHMLSQQNDMTQPPSPPSIHKVIPKQGSKAGGYDVTIIGTGFFNGLTVQFGDALANATTYWGPSTLVCIVPPSRYAGKVPVMVHNPMDPYGTTNLALKIPKFEYVDDEEIELLRRVIILLGHRDTGRPQDAASIARRILDQSASGSVGRDTGASTNGTYRHANGAMESAPAELDYEAAVLKCLDLIDMSDSPFPPRYDRKGENGQTILHLACAVGYYRLVAALLARGANPNARDRNGMTPMHVAAINDHLTIVRKLKNAGGDPLARSIAGWTPADMATSHGTRFAALNLTSFDSMRAMSPSTTSHSRASSISLHSLYSRHADQGFDAETDEALTDSEEDAENSEENDSDDYLAFANDTSSTAAQWAASRRNSTTSDLAAVTPSQFDITSHRYMQHVAAWRDQFAAQWQQLQQNLGLPPITFADYQNQTNLMVRGFEALRGSLPTGTIDSKARLQQTESQHWWEYLTGTTSPPAYDEIYPATDSAQDIKIESAARAALDAEADAKSRVLYSPGSAVSSSSTSSCQTDKTIASASDATTTNDEVLPQQRAKTPKRLRSDRKLFFVWIPLLVLLLVAMLKDRIPEMLGLARQVVEYTTGSTKEPHTHTHTQEDTLPRIEEVA